MRIVSIKGREYGNIQEVHDCLSKALAFPAYYGRNFSALYDVLTDISEDTRIVMDLTGIEDEAMEKGLERMAWVMAQASQENVYLEVECLE